jgi:hypothetical protein
MADEERSTTDRASRRVIAGLVASVVVLSGLLVFSLVSRPDEPIDEKPPKIAVPGIELPRTAEPDDILPLRIVPPRGWIYGECYLPLEQGFAEPAVHWDFRFALIPATVQDPDTDRRVRSPEPPADWDWYEDETVACLDMAYGGVLEGWIKVPSVEPGVYRLTQRFVNLDQLDEIFLYRKLFVCDGDRGPGRCRRG